MRHNYEIPQGLTDEIKWYNYFTLRSLIICLCVAGLGIPVIKLLSGLGITLYLIVLWGLLVIMVGFFTTYRIHNTNWLSGGGEYLDLYLIKRLIRKKRRCLYIKGYNQLFYEERNREALRDKEGEEKA